MKTAATLVIHCAAPADLATLKILLNNSEISFLEENENLILPKTPKAAQLISSFSKLLAPRGHPKTEYIEFKNLLPCKEEKSSCCVVS